MENENQNRIKKIEEYLLDPDKVIFQTMTEFEDALKTFMDFIAQVDFNELETIQGEDGYTPVYGVDYFTEAEIEAFEQFILSNMPVAGVDFPTNEQAMARISELVAKIPRVKGDKGNTGKDGKDGRDGSRDTGSDIIEKIRKLKKDGLKISDIKGLPAKITLLNDTSDDVELLKERFDSFKTVFPMVQEGSTGVVETITGEGSIDVDSSSSADPIISLVNDEDTPGNSKYYGTDESGVKGYHDLTSGGGAVDSVNGQTGVVVLDADDISDASTTNKYITPTQASNITTNNAKVSNATHTGDVTGSTVLTIANGAVDIPMLSATGTPNSGTYLRGDNTWAAVSAGGGSVDSVNSGTGVTVDNTDTANPIVNLSAGSIASLALADSAVQDLGDLGITATATELNYTDGVTSPIQTQLDAKGTGDMVLASVQSVTGLKTFDTTKLAVKGSSTGSTAIASANASGTNYTATLQAGTGTIYQTGGTDVSVADGGTGRSTGTTAYALVATGTTATGAQQTLANGGTTQVLVGGGASALPVWTTATGTGAPVRATSPNITTPTGIVKGDVGLGSVDNTTDAGKPVSTAQQTALDLKANLASPTFTGTVSGITSTMVGLGNVDNTSNATERAAIRTVSNMRVNPRTNSTTTAATLTPDLSVANVYFRTTQTATLTINAPIGTPVIGETLYIEVSSVAAQTLTINATYIPFGVAFPATTTAGKSFLMTCTFNGTNWRTTWANEI